MGAVPVAVAGPGRGLIDDRGGDDARGRSLCENPKSARLPSIPVEKRDAHALAVYMAPERLPVPFQTLFERIDWL